MTLCPMCARIMKVNDYKDSVCKCQGPLLCYPTLKELSTKGASVEGVLGRITVLITDGANDLARCDVLHRQGVKWNPQRQVFYIHWSGRHEAREFLSFLDTHNFKYIIEDYQP